MYEYDVAVPQLVTKSHYIIGRNKVTYNKKGPILSFLLKTHNSEKDNLFKMKIPSEMVQNLPYS